MATNILPSPPPTPEPFDDVARAAAADAAALAAAAATQASTAETKADQALGLGTAGAIWESRLPLPGDGVVGSHFVDIRTGAIYGPKGAGGWPAQPKGMLPSGDQAQLERQWLVVIPDLATGFDEVLATHPEGDVRLDTLVFHLVGGGTSAAATLTLWLQSTDGGEWPVRDAGGPISVSLTHAARTATVTPTLSRHLKGRAGRTGGQAFRLVARVTAVAGTTPRLEVSVLGRPATYEPPYEEPPAIVPVAKQTFSSSGLNEAGWTPITLTPVGTFEPIDDGGNWVGRWHAPVAEATHYLRYTLATAAPEVTLKARMRFVTLVDAPPVTNTAWLWRLTDTGGAQAVQLGVRFVAGVRRFVVTDNADRDITSVALPTSFTAIELSYRAGTGSNGMVKLKVGGVEVLNVTNSTRTTAITQFRVGINDANTWAGLRYDLDDIEGYTEALP